MRRWCLSMSSAAVPMYETKRAIMWWCIAVMIVAVLCIVLWALWVEGVVWNAP